MRRSTMGGGGAAGNSWRWLAAALGLACLSFLLVLLGRDLDAATPAGERQRRQSAGESSASDWAYVGAILAAALSPACALAGACIRTREAGGEATIGGSVGIVDLDDGALGTPEVDNQCASHKFDHILH